MTQAAVIEFKFKILRIMNIYLIKIQISWMLLFIPTYNI